MTDYDDDEPDERRAARTMRRFARDVDTATTAAELEQATERLHRRLAKARVTHEPDDD